MLLEASTVRIYCAKNYLYQFMCLQVIENSKQQFLEKWCVNLLVCCLVECRINQDNVCYLLPCAYRGHCRCSWTRTPATTGEDV